MAEQELAKIESEIATGIYPNGKEEVVPLWVAGDNMHFTLRAVRKAKGFTKAFVNTGTDIIHGIFQITQGADAVLYFGDKAKLYKWTKGVLTTEGTGFTGNDDTGATFWDSGTTTWDSGTTNWDGVNLVPVSGWDFESFGSFVLATNGKDSPQIDKGSGFGVLGGITGNFTTAALIGKLGPYIIFFNTDLNDREAIWSDTDQPEIYNSTAGNAAGSLILREAASQLIAVAPLGNQLAIFSKNQMFLFRFIGSPLFFGYEQVFGVEIGAVSKKGVVPAARKLYSFGENEIYVTDGVSAEGITNDEIRRHIFGNINTGQLELVAGYNDKENTTIKWFYPSASSTQNDRGVGYNYETNVWTKYDHGKSAGLEKALFDFPFIANASGEVFFDNLGLDKDDTRMRGDLTAKNLHFGDSNLVKFISRMRIGGNGDFQMRIDVANDLATFTIGDWEDVVSDMRDIPVRKTGRWIRIKFRNENIGEDWSLERIVFYGQIEGER